jgi:hypothetical protein
VSYRSGLFGSLLVIAISQAGCGSTNAETPAIQSTTTSTAIVVKTESISPDADVSTVFRWDGSTERRAGNPKSATLIASTDTTSHVRFPSPPERAECINSATLQLWLESGTARPEGGQIAVYPSSLFLLPDVLNGDVVKTNDLVSNRPLSMQTVGLAPGWFSWDVTDIVQAWKTGKLSTNSTQEQADAQSQPIVFAVQPPARDDPLYSRVFSSLERGGEHTPRLQVEIKSPCG